MTIKTHIVGSGITRQKRISVSTPWGPDEIETLNRLIPEADGRPGWQQELDDARTWAEETLRRAELPTDPAGLYNPQTAMAYAGPPPRSEPFCLLTGLVRDREWDAPEWFAAEILLQAHLLERTRAQGDIDAVIWHAIRLGRFIEIAFTKILWERDVQRGQKWHEQQRKAALAGRSVWTPRLDFAAEGERLRQVHPDMSLRAIAHTIHRARQIHATSAEQVRKYLGPYRRNLIRRKK